MPNYQELPCQEAIIARFWRHVEKTETCWLWRSAAGKRAYPVFALHSGSSIPASRFCWELVNGPVPEGLYLYHACDQHACVNPEHFFLGRPSAKLTPQEVEHIRRLYATGEYTQSALARMFDVKGETIRLLLKGRTWQRVP